MTSKHILNNEMKKKREKHKELKDYLKEYNLLGLKLFETPQSLTLINKLQYNHNENLQ